MGKKNAKNTDKNFTKESVAFEMAKYLWSVELHGDHREKQAMFLELTAECARALKGDYKPKP